MVFKGNKYHFYEVSNALASYSYKIFGTVVQPETGDLCFQRIEEHAEKKFPDLEE